MSGYSCVDYSCYNTDTSWNAVFFLMIVIGVLVYVILQGSFVQDNKGGYNMQYRYQESNSEGNPAGRRGG